MLRSVSYVAEVVLLVFDPELWMYVCMCVRIYLFLFEWKYELILKYKAIGIWAKLRNSKQVNGDRKS